MANEILMLRLLGSNSRIVQMKAAFFVEATTALLLFPRYLNSLNDSCLDAELIWFLAQGCKSLRSSPSVFLFWLIFMITEDYWGQRNSFAEGLEWLLQIMLEVTEGLARMHVARVIHRDLKPANIMLGMGPTGISARISDLGSAVQLAMPLVGDTALSWLASPECIMVMARVNFEF